MMTPNPIPGNLGTLAPYVKSHARNLGVILTMNFSPNSFIELSFFHKRINRLQQLYCIA